jgi:hypothetical protein
VGNQLRDVFVHDDDGDCLLDPSAGMRAGPTSVPLHEPRAPLIVSIESKRAGFMCVRFAAAWPSTLAPKHLTTATSMIVPEAS